MGSNLRTLNELIALLKTLNKDPESALEFGVAVFKLAQVV